MADCKPPKPTRFGLVIFPEFEVLNVSGPLECLNTLARMSQFPYANDLTLSILGASTNPYTGKDDEFPYPLSSGPAPGDTFPTNCSVAQSLMPTHTFEDPPELFVLLVPGGYGTGPKTPTGFEPDVGPVIDFLQKTFPKVQYLITVCTGAGLAARAGLLDGHKATTNKQAWDSVTATGPKTYSVGQARWVVTDDRKIWTTSGVSAGTDGFLAWLEEVFGVGVVADCCQGMEYTRARCACDDRSLGGEIWDKGCEADGLLSDVEGVDRVALAG